VYEDVQATLKATGPHAVAYAMQGFGDYKESDVASGLKARDYKDATDLVCGVDCRNMNEYPELYPTLQAKPNGGQSLNFSGAVRVRYIVRRLTPTECARLQGFADRWGEIEEKDSFTEEEYRFWQDVRNTHAAINGKAVKDYTEKQMLTWYNKLSTDSAEYKMWGNGIALFPAMYCMQGILDVLERTRK
jgi:DNA (cytosine-5)-methyltransferase 1